MINQKFIFIFVFLLGLMPFAKAESAQLRCEASIEGDASGGYVLSWNLVNDTKAPVSILADELPWNTRMAVVIVLIPLIEGVPPVASGLLIEDPRAVYVKIPPHQNIAGKVKVGERIPNIRRTLQRSDAALFWSFKVNDLTQPHSKEFRFSGYFILKKITERGKAGGKPDEQAGS